MANNETMQEKTKTSTSEAFSYSWYPTQCEIGASSRETAPTNNDSLSQDSYRVFKTDTDDDEMVVVQQDAPEQASRRPTQYVVNLSNKFTDQQVKVLMKTWKELYDRRQHFRTSESDWHDITDKVNMAPGSAKTVKQVKKKFKNLRDRYRASKIKNKKRNFGFSKSISFAQFEQVYGDLDKQDTRHGPRNSREDDLQNTEEARAGRRTVKPTNQLQSARSMQVETTRNPAEPQNSLEMHKKSSPTYSHTQSTRMSAPSLTISMQGNNDMSTAHAQSQKFNFPGNIPQNTTSMRGAALEVADFRSGIINSISPITTNTGARHPSLCDSVQDSQLVNAVRELQQQQITMQRELMRSMKQMEDRIMGEISIKMRESEEQFRQQIANALTQLGNLIRIT
eukprot:gene14161-5162_t